MPSTTTIGRRMSGPASRNAKNSQPNTAMPAIPKSVTVLRPSRSDTAPHSGPVTSPTAEAIMTAVTPEVESPR